MNVIITGASKGIGKATALKFAESGATLFLCARNNDTLQKTIGEIRHLYPSVVIHSYQADLSIKVQVEDFAMFCLKIGVPNIVVNNVGTYLPGKVMDEVEGNLEKALNTNLFSAYYLTRKILPSMIKNGSGHIFNMCSIASLKGYEGGGSYGISKFALNGFNQNLRLELMKHNIKVTGVFPGAVITNSWGDFDNTSKRMMEPSDIAQMIFSATQLSDQAVVEDIVIRPMLGDL